MQMQPYQPQGLAAGNGERIHVPTPGGAPGAPGGPDQPPSLLTVFGREVRKRKPLVAVWALVTAIVTGAVVFQFARPLYRAEGRFAYVPNYRAGGHQPIYTPPNIQSAVQILKAPEVLEPIRERHLPGLSKAEFANDVRIEVSKQSEFIEVSFDHPDPALATAVAGDLMQEGLKHFAHMRVEATKEGIVRLREDLAAAKRRQAQARDEYVKAYQALGFVAEPAFELDRIKLDLTDLERRRIQAETRKDEIQFQIKFEEKRLEAPPDADAATLDDSLLPLLTGAMQELQNQMVNDKDVGAARIKLKQYTAEEERMRPYVRTGAVPRTEYDRVVGEINLAEATLKQAEMVKAKQAELRKQFDKLKEQARTSRPGRKAIRDSIIELKKEEAAIPTTLEHLKRAHEQKQASLAKLAQDIRDLEPKKDEADLRASTVKSLDTQLNDAERGQDANVHDLRVFAPAAAGTTPHTTNTPKLALAVVGVSAFLFVGYIALFCLPRLAPDAAGGLVAGPAARLPRALVALVPFTHANGPAAAVNDLVPTGATAADPPFANPEFGSAPAPAPADVHRKARADTGSSTATPEPDPVPPRKLAERMVEDGVDHGGIVLFTPTAEQLNVAPAIGEMGRIFTQRGERVLMFDARHTAETPSWAGPDAPAVASRVEGYLDGRPAAPTECFVPTSLKGVEYSRADLSTRVGGVMAAHRFRQLVEEMRERYSVVFLVGPPVTVDGGDPLLNTLAEGMVLVTESSATPSEVHALIETLSQQMPARLYGTLSVPRA